MSEINWGQLGVSPIDFPDCAGSRSGQLTIVGCARCVHDDLAKYPVHQSLMTVNDIAMHLHHKIDHMYSNHGLWLSLIREMRYKRHRYVPLDEGRKPDLHTLERETDLHKIGNAIPWPFPGHGSSGLSAVYVGLALGYESIILAGMPMDNSGHYFDPPYGHPMARQRLSNFDPTEDGMSQTNKNMKVWVMARDKIFAGRVKSLSGNTKEWLGAP